MLLLGILFILTLLPGMAETFTIGNLKYTTIDETTVSVSKNETVSGALEIPAQVEYNEKTYSVTSIEEWGFSGCTGLTSVTIPNSVTSIRYDAFYNCTGLTSVTIPNSVASIGIFAFDSCSSMTSVTLPNSVTNIGGYAFSGCSSLTSVIIPNSVTNIGDGIFSGCSGLTSMTLPNSVKSIGSYTFENCSSLTSVIIPNSVTSIGERAFDGCSGLKDIYSLAQTPPSIFHYYSFSSYSSTIHVPTGCKVAYQTAAIWQEFNIVEEDLSDIKTPVLSHEEKKAPCYDLQGRKVDYPSKGIYIHNGKKVLLK